MLNWLAAKAKSPTRSRRLFLVAPASNCTSPPLAIAGGFHFGVNPSTWP